MEPQLSESMGLTRAMHDGTVEEHDLLDGRRFLYCKSNRADLFCDSQQLSQVSPTREQNVGTERTRAKIVHL